jgi:DNA segregation ATPase FtsK/SpoIIIE-like protein
MWLQLRATLRGRRCFVVDSAGLAIVVAREPGEPQRKRLPATIPLTPEELRDGLYTVTLGHDRRGRVILDLADDHRAILIGGTSGGGKTNGMQAILTQLVLKHAPDELQIAVVDTKEVDFSGPWAGLPHLFQPIGYDLEDAESLIEQVEAERVRRQAAMARAGVSDWRNLPDPPPLLILVVDEAADFQGTVAMETLTQVARKGRAFGVSVILGTQYPTSKVIDAQIKANLPTAIAFQCRSGTESRVIIDRTGAEELSRPGLALTYIGGRWRKVQVLKADPGLLEDVAGYTEPDRPALEEIEADLVTYALEELEGAFTVGKLYDALGDRVSRRQINKLARAWERRGWLTEPQRDENGHPIGRLVTEELAALASGLPSPTPGGNGR